MNPLAKYLVEEIKGKTVAVYAGGFKPPTKGHFEVVEIALRQNPEIDEFKIFVGTAERDGVTQEESVLIWEIYNKYLPMKVEIIPSKVAPIKAVYDEAKNNPNNEILWVIGARDGNEEDFSDIAKRTTSIEKYPHLELRTIVTKGGISGTAARNALHQTPDKFFNYLPDKLTGDEKLQVQNILSPSTETSLQEGIETIDYKSKIVELTKHMIDQGKSVQPLPKVIFKHDEAESEDFFGKTGLYLPSEQTIILYVKDRHPKDIVRSFSHEMIHHIQNIEDRLPSITTTNTNDSDDLDKIEKEAYLDGNMTFRNWTDSIIGTQMKEEKKKDPFGLSAYARELALLREDEGEYKIYLDMDGVVADFDRRFRELSGMAPKEFENKHGKNAFWDFIDEGDNKIKFWVGIPPMDGAQELVSYIDSNFEYEMLTAPSAKKQSRLGKNLWIRNWTNKGLFPSKPKVNFRKAKEKHNIKPELSKFDILIDDRESTINNWNNAGGTGILFQSAQQVINDLQNVKERV